MSQTIYINGHIGVNEWPRFHPGGVTIRITGDVYIFAKKQCDVTTKWTNLQEPMAYFFDNIQKYKIKNIIAYSCHAEEETEHIHEILQEYEWEIDEKGKKVKISFPIDPSKMIYKSSSEKIKTILEENTVNTPGKPGNGLQSHDLPLGDKTLQPRANTSRMM